MEELDFFYLTPINQNASILTTSRRPESVNVKGSVLEKQFSLPNGWHLILTTADSPYDEALYITVIDQHFEVTDQIEISSALVPGILEDVEVQSHNRLKFSFNKADPYILTIDPKGFIIPRSSDKGRRPLRTIFKKKYLHIH
ncbi:MULTISPECIES: hypothetical protein [unclassified Marinimicrobium]|jgi:hypothetical protein|uniref:hypothetical protein n=2 Tax=Marinimicrobium TaxID=359337 RepID=UPI000C3FB0DE|nr:MULTISPECIES: hypothetical protein [unclassified Marinimicrobium]MAN53304.1 hypothetical protein [Marinimicrobium sp.]|tara:strand:+ start:1185 stop:1610 length:426 start_codon:yes stop_codon:yes gene_type:complete